MGENVKSTDHRIRIGRYGWALALLWTIAIGALFTDECVDHLEHVRERIVEHVTQFAVLWLLGLGGIGFGAARLGRQAHEKELAEEALRASEKRMKLAMDGTDEGLWDWDVQKGEIIVDDNWQRLLGYAPGETDFDAAWWEENIHPDAQAGIEAALDAYVSGHEKYYELEYRIRSKTGDWMWIWARSTCVAWDKDGNPLRMIGTYRNIDERKAMQQELEDHTQNLERLVAERASRIHELERQRSEMETLAATGRMAAAVAHEINNPLAGIKNAFLVLKDAIPKDHEDYHFADLILREIERISNIVRQMYELYRPDSASMVPVDLASELESACNMLETRIKQRSLRLRTFPVPALPKLILPEGHIRQVLYNLVVNAIEASPEGGEIRLAVTHADDAIHIRVSDDGEGIPPDALGRIFEPFFTTKKRKGDSGMGLGLSVSQSLAKTMGGGIHVETEAGHGTTFVVVLPYKADTQKIPQD